MIHHKHAIISSSSLKIPQEKSNFVGENKHNIKVKLHIPTPPGPRSSKIYNTKFQVKPKSKSTQTLQQRREKRSQPSLANMYVSASRILQVGIRVNTIEALKMFQYQLDRNPRHTTIQLHNTTSTQSISSQSKHARNPINPKEEASMTSTAQFLHVPWELRLFRVPKYHLPGILPLHRMMFC